jgi:hypothetical protein
MKRVLITAAKSAPDQGVCVCRSLVRDVLAIKSP